MWQVIPAVAIVLAQAAQPSTNPKPEKWCFERKQQGAQLCEATEDACKKLRDVNTEIAKSACKRVEPQEIPVLTSPSGSRFQVANVPMGSGQSDGN